MDTILVHTTPGTGRSKSEPSTLLKFITRPKRTTLHVEKINQISFALFHVRHAGTLLVISQYRKTTYLVPLP